MVLVCLSFFHQVDSKGQILKTLLRINTAQIVCVLEADLKYPKELRKLYNDYHLATNKIEIKKEILPKYQLMISDFYNITIDNFK